MRLHESCVLSSCPWRRFVWRTRIFIIKVRFDQQNLVNILWMDWIFKAKWKLANWNIYKKNIPEVSFNLTFLISLLMDRSGRCYCRTCSANYFIHSESIGNVRNGVICQEELTTGANSNGFLDIFNWNSLIWTLFKVNHKWLSHPQVHDQSNFCTFPIMDHKR